jgi:hypothetical protein
VPRALVDEALALTQHAPSNSNIQPWRMVITSCVSIVLLWRVARVSQDAQREHPTADFALDQWWLVSERDGTR